MVQGDSTRTRGLNGLRAVLFAAVGVVLLSAAIATAQQSEEGIAYSGDYPASVGPWDVILYEHPNYLGTWVRYTLQPGMRQRLVPAIVPALDDKASSIQVGEMVGVMIFEHRLYSAGEFEGSQQFEASVPRLGTNTPPLDDKTSSLIIYPKAAGFPCGASLTDIRSDVTGKHAFFPLPEWEASTEARYGSLGQVDMDDDANSAFAMCTKSWENRIQLILYSEPGFRGRAETLPGPTGWQGWVDDSRSNLGAVNLSDAASSLVVRWTGAPAALGPPAPPSASTKAAIGLTERIRGFQVAQQDGRRVRFRIDYTINSTHGPSIGVGTWLYAGGEAFGGYEPVMFAPQGHGSVEQWVTLPPETRTYDEVEFFFFEPGQQPFLKARLPLKQTWAP